MPIPQSPKERVREHVAAALAARRDGCHNLAANAVEKIRAVEREQAEQQIDRMCAATVDMYSSIVASLEEFARLLKLAYPEGGRCHE